MTRKSSWILARTSLARRMREFESLPQPDDETTLTVPGADPLRLLVIGGGIVVGTGVLTHDLGIGGHLARALSTATGRGAVVEVHPIPGISISEAPALLRDAATGRDLDGIVLAVGLNDAIIGTPPAKWFQHLGRVLDVGITALSTEGRLFLLEIADPTKSPLFRPLVARATARRARRLNALSSAMVSVTPRASLLRFDLVRVADSSHMYDASYYRGWAAQLAPGIVESFIPH